MVFGGTSRAEHYLDSTTDPTTRLFLFPDHPTTFELSTQLRAGRLQHVGLGQEYQAA
jgi:hypothetical protein